MVCTPTRHGMKTNFRWEPPHPPNAQKVLTRNFPQLSAESCDAIMNAHARSVRKSLSATFRKFPSSCRMLLRQILRFSTFRRSFRKVSAGFRRTFCRTFRRDFPQDLPHKVSAGLSAGFPHRCVQSIAAEVLENPVLAGPQGRRALRGPSTLQKLVRQTVREQMLTNRATEHFATSFRRGPLPGGPFSLLLILGYFSWSPKMLFKLRVRK